MKDRWSRLHSARWEMLGMIITRETWSGKAVFLFFEDGEKLSAGDNTATLDTLPDAKRTAESWLGAELVRDSNEAEKEPKR